MDRAWHPFTEWECVNAGMYVPMDPADERVAEAVAVLGNEDKCGLAMCDVIERWPVSCEQSLSDQSRNRRAWLGRAAVCCATGHPESVTRVAWFRLSAEQQDAANAIADRVIREWADDYTRRNGCQRHLWG